MSSQLINMISASFVETIIMVLISGGIGAAIGTLTLLVTAPVAVYQEAVKYIRERGVLVEEIPNV